MTLSFTDLSVGQVCPTSQELRHRPDGMKLKKNYITKHFYIYWNIKWHCLFCVDRWFEAWQVSPSGHLHYSNRSSSLAYADIWNLSFSFQLLDANLLFYWSLLWFSFLQNKMCTSTNETIGLNNPWLCEKMYIWIYTLLFSFLLAFPGATAILLDMVDKIRKRTPLTPSNIFFLNITIMDTMYLLLLQPQLYVSADQENCVLNAFVNFLHAFNWCGRPLFLTCVCIECYVAVIHPVTYRARKGLTSRLLITVSNWIVTAIYGFYFALTQFNTSKLTPVIVLILTLPVIVFCDISVLSALKKSGPTGRSMDPHKRRARHVISSSCIITVISYLPSIISWSIFQLQHFKETKFDPCVILVPSFCISTAGNAVSVILHVVNTGKLVWLKSWLKCLYAVNEWIFFLLQP